MKPLDKIYAITQGSRVIGCSEKPFKYSEEYIRKDALLELVKEQWLHTRNGTLADQIRSSAYEEMIKHIESL